MADKKRWCGVEQVDEADMRNDGAGEADKQVVGAESGFGAAWLAWLEETQGWLLNGIDS